MTQESWRGEYAAIVAKMLGAGLDREEIAARLGVSLDWLEWFLEADFALRTTASTGSS